MVASVSARSASSVATATAVTLATSASAAADMAYFNGPSDLEAGRVLVIQLDAIAERLSGAWQGRRVEVYDFAQRTLAKRLKGRVVRLSETEFLASAPGLGAEQAEERAVRAMREIVDAFISESALTDLRLSRAIAIGTDQVVTTPLDCAQILLRSEQRSPRNAEPEEGRIASQGWAPFVAADGRLVRPSCVLEPVFELAGSSRIGYRLRQDLVDVATGLPVARAVRRCLSRADTLRIDRAVLTRGIDRLSATSPHEAQVSLIIPVSYFTLTHPEAGPLLSAMFARARNAVRAGVICEIYDIEDISQASLAAAIALVRPWCLLVVGHLSEEPPRASSAMKAAGVQALSFSTPRTLESDAEFIGWLRSGIVSAHRVGRSVMVYGCHSRRRLGIAGLLGASHASLTA